MAACGVTLAEDTLAFSDQVGDLPKSQLAKGQVLTLKEVLIWNILFQFSNLRNTLSEVSFLKNWNWVLWSIKVNIWGWFPFDDTS